MALTPSTSTPVSVLINSGSSFTEPSPTKPSPTEPSSTEPSPTETLKDPSSPERGQRVSRQRSNRRILAAVFPDLLNELVSQRIRPTPSTLQGSTAAARKELLHEDAPRAVVLSDPSHLDLSRSLSPRDELDAVNSVAHRLGVRVHQSIAHASAIVECLRIHSLPRSDVLAALKQISEIALAFGSPVSFQLPDTVWVDVSGSSHLFGSEHDLAFELSSRIRGLGHAVQIAIANGPWLAQSFAKYCDPEESGVMVICSALAERAAARLPIIALPLERDSVAWLSRLGLLTLEDLRTLPTSALASRIEEPSILEFIHGRDETLLLPFYPEEKPCEEQFWEDGIESIEPLLFVLKGLVSRLSARLEGRGQAVQELALVIYYDRSNRDRTISGHVISGQHLSPISPEPRAISDRSSAALSRNEFPFAERVRGANDQGKKRTSSAMPADIPAAAVPVIEENKPPESLKLSFKFAAPLAHSDELERILRLRLQRQSLIAPAMGISLRASLVTEATPNQLRLSNSLGWISGTNPDPRRISILAAELSEDVGAHAVGRLSIRDSHLPEESGCLSSISSLSLTPTREEAPTLRISQRNQIGSQNGVQPTQQIPSVPIARISIPRVPTRIFIPPLEIHASIRKDELWVVKEQPFLVHQFHFEQRLEEVEWWHASSIFRDYFRVWLTTVNRTPANFQTDKPSHALRRSASSGIEVLVYRDRIKARVYIQATYD
jgi:protein ImuB